MRDTEGKFSRPVAKGRIVVNTGYSRTSMDGESQRTIAVWAFYIFSFLIFIVFIYIQEQEQLTIEIIALYWFPAVVLTIIGTIPPPWEPLV